MGCLLLHCQSRIEVQIIIFSSGESDFEPNSEPHHEVYFAILPLNGYPGGLSRNGVLERLNSLTKITVLLLLSRAVIRHEVLDILAMIQYKANQ